jgi:hypothetical protein
MDVITPIAAVVKFQDFHQAVFIIAKVNLGQGMLMLLYV